MLNRLFSPGPPAGIQAPLFIDGNRIKHRGLSEDLDMSRSSRSSTNLVMLLLSTEGTSSAYFRRTKLTKGYELF